MSIPGWADDESRTSDYVEVFQDADGWYWRRKSAGHEEITTSMERHEDAAAAAQAAANANAGLLIQDEDGQPIPEAAGQVPA